MNQETIENHIKNLSKTDFDSVLSLILNRVFELNAIDVDGKGDGGADFRCFSDSGGNRSIAVQKTVQEANWQTKAIEDAGKARENFDSARFFFLTSRARESTALLKLQNEIFITYRMPATCLGATEIAGLIIENKLLGDFGHAINLLLICHLGIAPTSVRYYCIPILLSVMINAIYGMKYTRMRLFLKQRFLYPEKTLLIQPWSILVLLSRKYLNYQVVWMPFSQEVDYEKLGTNCS